MLKRYGVVGKSDAARRKVLVDKSVQQRAEMLLRFNGLLGGGGISKSVTLLPESDRTELKIPTSDPAAAVRRLAKYGIPSEHDLKFASIVLPNEFEERAAMVLTFTGMLPSGREAYGFLNESDLAMTDHRTRIQYICKLQDMLAETIALMPGVSQAEVFLSEHAKPWEFRVEDRKLDGKVSVKVETTHGGRMTEEEQLAIASLVAGSFMSLTEANVRISDFALNYYPIIDDSWQMTLVIQSRQRQLQRDAERKIELQLAAYNARAAVTIPMLIVKVESPKKAKTQYGTSGEEADAGRDEVHDPGRRLDAKPRPAEPTPAPTGRSGTSGQEFDAGRDAVHDPGRNIDDTTGIKSAHNDILQPDYANASAAITLIHPTALSADKIAEAKRIASAASGIPADRIQILVEQPNQQPANR